MAWKTSARDGADASPIRLTVEISAIPQMVRYGTLASPFGPAAALLDENGVCGLGFGREAELLAEYRKTWPQTAFRRDDAAAGEVADILERGGTLHLSLCGTGWQIQVWRALLNLPRGKTVSYGELARELGRPQAARAVGAAVGVNPIAWLVPCHRVVGKNGVLTGYRWGLERKRAMLAAEGNAV